MNIKLQLPTMTHLRPRITVVGVGGAGSNAVNNMIASGLSGVNFCVANTDSQSLANSAAEQHIQLGAKLTEGLGAGAKPEIGRASAEEAIEEIRAKVAGSHMVFVAAGMGGGTGTGAAAVIARIARESGALTVGVVTKPFHFEGSRRMRAAESGIAALKPEVDTLIVIPNQNLFRIANERTTFAEAFVLADQVLYSGIACVVDLIVKEGLINLDFADVRTIMSGMGTAMMGTGEASGERRAVVAAEEAISNPLLDDISLRGARGLLVSITGSHDLKLYEVDEAAQRVRQEVDAEANIIVGATFDDTLGDRIRVSIVASGMERLGENAQSWDQQSAPVAQPVVATAIPSNQPPFIEPYPEPTALPAPPPQTYPHPAHEHSAMSRDIRSQPDFARALSEALDSHPAPTHHDNPPQYPPPQPTWSSANGAVFTDAPPALGREASSDGLSSINRPPEHQLGFHPQPPAETRTHGRRLPEVNDFPPLAQREYHAKIREYGDAAIPPPPRALTQPAQPKVKHGFFARLFGRKPRRKVTEPSPTYQQGVDPRQHPVDALRQTSRAQVDASPRAPGRTEEEAYELPAFFGSKRN